MAETLKNAFDVSWNGDIDILLFIIPFKSETTVEGSGHVGSNFVLLM